MLYEMRLVGLAMDPFSNSPIVILKDRNAAKESSVMDLEFGGGPDKAELSTSNKEADGKSDEVDERILPIWIGESEAQSIASALLKLSVPRPMTHDLLKSVIASMGGSVGRIIVTDLAENTFYAAIEVILSDGETITIDARPSDALALALRCEAGIFVDGQVIEKTYKSESKPQVLEEDVDDFTQDKWEEMVEKITGQSMKKYKQ